MPTPWAHRGELAVPVSAATNAAASWACQRIESSRFAEFDFLDAVHLIQQGLRLSPLLMYSRAYRGRNRSPEREFKKLVEDYAMRLRSALNSTTAKSAALGFMGFVALANPVWAQEGGANAPWRGAGEKPCFGAEGGSHMCPQPNGVVAVRAGRLFDSKTGQMLVNQVVVLD